jgi:enterochelin esterase-like enzyme
MYLRAAVAVVTATLVSGAVGAPAARHATPPGLPAGWTLVSTGPAGGTVWQGWIPDAFATWDRRSSAVYLPPGYSASQRYPVVYLLHGMRGSPAGFWDGMRLATVADGLISGGSAAPFIVVMPVAGPALHPDSGEWAGIWEDFVVHDVVAWTDQHLSTVPTPAARAVEGLCAGGFGAMDIGLRHPGLFATLGSWEGYFAPVFRDGPFRHAGAAELSAHDPQLLVRAEVDALRRDGTRFYISYDGNHGHVLGRWSTAFAAELGSLALPYRLVEIARSERKHFWGLTFPSALLYATNGFAARGV